MNYTLTLQDVEDYLDSKQPDEVIGITCHSEKCLVSEAFIAKYPEVISASIGGGYATIGLRDDSALKTIKLSTDMQILYHRFDGLNKGEIERPVTRREWEVSHDH